MIIVESSLSLFGTYNKASFSFVNPFVSFKKKTDTIIPQNQKAENNKYIPSGFIYLNPVSENKLKNMFAVHFHTVANATPFGGNISALYKYIIVPIEVPKKKTYVTVNITIPKFHPVNEVIPDANKLTNIPMHP